MKYRLITLFIFCCLVNTARAQSPSVAINNLIKNGVIKAKDRTAIERELRYIKTGSHASYPVEVLGALYAMLLQEKFHVNLHKTGLFYGFSKAHFSKNNQDSINSSLRILLEKIKKSGLLTERVYTYAQKNIDSSQYVIDLQMIGGLAEMNSRFEWLAPGKLLPIAGELHNKGIVSDSAFMRLKDDINNEKIESSSQLSSYCMHTRRIVMEKYLDDPNVWLEQLHGDIASILPGLKFTDFKYAELPDTSFNIPGIRYKISLAINGHTYKYLSFPVSSIRSKGGKITPKDLFINDFYRIFNKVLTDQQSPFRIHSITFGRASAENIRQTSLIVLKDEQADVFMTDPCMSYMLASMDVYNPAFTSAKVDSMITGWEKAGLFAHLSKPELIKAIDNAQSVIPFSLNNLLSNFPNVTYELHESFSGPRQPYKNLLLQLAKITHGNFTPSNITQTKIGNGLKLQYSFNNKTHLFKFPTAYGWMDTKFPVFFKTLARENNLPGNFYHLLHEDAVIYLTKQQYEYLTENKLLDFAPVK